MDIFGKRNGIHVAVLVLPAPAASGGADAVALPWAFAGGSNA